MPTDPPNGVHSEVGRLRRVLVCEPGLAHRRLTPTNASDLLFDDVLWVENAIRDHRAFVAELRARDVEVLELHEVLAETMAVPGARDWLLDRKIVPEDVGLELIDDTREFLERLEPRAARRVPHRRPGDRRHHRRVRRRPLRARRVLPRRARVRDAAAAQHPLHARHHLLAVRRRHPQPALLPGPARRDAADEGRLPVPPGLRRLHRLVGRPGAALGTLDHRGRRRHAGRQRDRARRDERTDVTAGHHPAGGGAVRPGRRRPCRRRRDAPAARGDAPRHGVHVRGPRRA